jgi:hypothetical protein
MPGTPQNAMGCPEFEAFMAEALDGLLPAAEAVRFQEHRATCLFCDELFAEAETGRNLLHSLQEAVPPPDMVERILAATSHPPSRRAATGRGNPWERVRSWVVEGSMAGWSALATLSQPRFAMSFAMAFFSIAMLLNVTGLQVQDIRSIDLRPAAFVHTYELATGKLVRYYENIRIVYEIQSRVEELRQSSEETEPAAPEDKVQPTHPTGVLQPGRNGPGNPPNAQDAWLQSLPSWREPLTEDKAVHARIDAMSGPGTDLATDSDSSARSTL